MTQSEFEELHRLTLEEETEENAKAMAFVRIWAAKHVSDLSGNYTLSYSPYDALRAYRQAGVAALPIGSGISGISGNSYWTYQ